MNEKKLKINIIGPYPPPYGGISVHVKRTFEYLKTKNIETSIYNECKNNAKTPENIIEVQTYKTFLFKIPFLNANVLHFHTINKNIRILLPLYKMFGKKIILTVHGESIHDQIKRSGKISRSLLIQSLKCMDKIICVNQKIENDLVANGIDKSKLKVIPAYINPIENNNDKDDIKKEVWDFVDNAEILISANGWIRFYKNEDLYGVDMLVRLMKKLKKDYSNVKMIIALIGVSNQSVEERAYYEKIRKDINEYGLENSIYIYEVENTEFYPILEKSQLFIRPTNTDGDAVSLRESIYYKVPSVASDVFERPQGTILFKTRSDEDLYEKVKDIINSYDVQKNKLDEITTKDYIEELFQVYEEVAEK